MIVINKVKFAKDEKEFIGSLFSKGGTCSGYYKVLKNKIRLMDKDKIEIGCITNKRVLAKTSLVNGRKWYSYGDINLIGKFNSYKDEAECITRLVYQYL